MFLTCLSLGLESVSLVWGDRYADGDGSKNVYDFRSLAEAVAEARHLPRGPTSTPRSSLPSTSRR